jgi:hypothetical protein
MAAAIAGRRCIEEHTPHESDGAIVRHAQYE